MPNEAESDDLDAAIFPPLIEAFLANINANVRWGQLLHDEDLFELTHIEALATDHLRVGCRQILEVSLARGGRRHDLHSDLDVSLRC